MRSVTLASLMLLALTSSGCITFDLGLPRGPLKQKVIYGEKGPKILMLDLSGALSTTTPTSVLGIHGESQTARLRAVLEEAADDKEIQAVLLRIDSPGGTVSASEILHGEVMRYKREHELPVVAQMMGTAASGGYYVAMAADEVRAYPSTITGSIGVIMFGVNFSGLMDKIGVENQTLTTGAYKDAGSFLRPMRPNERKQLQGVADDLFLGFLDVVEAGRPKLTRERIEELADGRVYTASQALEAGLVDEVGDLPEAVEATKKAAGIEGDARVVVYRRSGERKENLFSAAVQGSPPRADGLLEAEQPGFLYLWAPGLH